MIPAYQLWSQPHFEWLEFTAERSAGWPKVLSPKVLRYGYRTIYVVLITFLASKFCGGQCSAFLKRLLWTILNGFLPFAFFPHTFLIPCSFDALLWRYSR